MDFISLPAEHGNDESGSRFQLTLAAAKRARLLCKGASPVLKKSRSRKMTTLALEELMSGSVKVLSGDAAVKAREEAESLNHDGFIDEAGQKASHPEELTKFEKEFQLFLREKEELAGKSEHSAVEKIPGDE